MNYVRWTCINEDKVFTRIKVHPECEQAWSETMLDSTTEDVSFGEHTRGCICESSGPGCTACVEDPDCSELPGVTSCVD